MPSVDIPEKYQKHFNLDHARGRALKSKNIIFQLYRMMSCQGSMERYNPGEHHEMVLKSIGPFKGPKMAL